MPTERREKPKVGDTFRTGEFAPVSGVYEFVGHADGTPASPSPGEQRIPLSRGERFPPCRAHNAPVIWRLVEIA